MLQPTNRLTLIDAMRPPVAFRLESAMAVTFTLDLRALLAAPAALALTGPDGVASVGGTHEPIELLHALRSHASKITVFSQVGEIALPPSRRVFAFLEQAVVPVAAPLGGVVHPKVWVFRYQATGEPPDSQSRKQRLRVLIASRNLTFDASWDTVVRLDEATGAAGARLEPVGELFEGLLGAAVGTVSTDHQQRVQSLSAALQTATFALPDGVDHLQTHVLGLSRTPSPLPARVARSLIISPFVSNDFFLRVRPEPVDELVSRAESLDLLGPDALANVVSAYAFDDGSAPDFETAEEGPSIADPGRPLVGLHAKVFAFEGEGRARLFLGSANATGAAFNSNVEILVELAGPTEVLGIDRLCGGTGDEPGLRDLFNTYDGPSPNGNEENGTSLLDGARRSVARTHVAKGVIAQVIDYLRRTGDKRHDIVYICSNAAIARQNIRKLVPAGIEPLQAERLTMLPLTELSEGDSQHTGINLLAITPGTSLDFGRSTGRFRERCLAYAFLRARWGKSVMTAPARRVFWHGVNHLLVPVRRSGKGRQARAPLQGAAFRPHLHQLPRPC